MSFLFTSRNYLNIITLWQVYLKKKHTSSSDSLWGTEKQLVTSMECLSIVPEKKTNSAYFWCLINLVAYSKTEHTKNENDTEPLEAA